MNNLRLLNVMPYLTSLLRRHLTCHRTDPYKLKNNTKKGSKLGCGARISP